ncbi:CST complex subunit STN1-like [Dendronephthya gigantea]|uniref:CST complex subunit STN1-like n=1 Tax=Dendronephthya gigantea TaxID=151771 RepID=UPI001068F5E4|nr:CST complex subunit STN1-like [Dendronephthya gigantea]
MENALPVKFWGLDPLYWTHVKLFARDVLKLKEYPGFTGVYAISNHPIVHALVVGYIVKVDKREKLTNYGVDDGTGFLPCCMWHDQSNGIEADFGDLVTVMGRISTFREERQITLSKLNIETDSNVEVLHWLEVMKLKEVYQKPFKPPQDPKQKTVKPKPWIKNELDAEIDRLEELLKTTIREYLEAKNVVTFNLSVLLELNNVVEIVKQLLNKFAERSNGGKGEVKRIHISSKDIGQVVKESLRKLEKDGILWCKYVTDFVNTNNREFEFFSIAKDLSPSIVAVIKETSESEGETSYGIAFKKIMEKLKSLEKYQYVRRDRVKDAIEHLMSTGDIYEAIDYHYRVV